MAVDLMHNVDGGAAAVDRLMAAGFDVGVLRPWRGLDGKSYVTRSIRNHQGQLIQKNFVTNAPATLPRQAWIAFDTAVVRALRERLRAFADIRAAGLEYNLPNGMAYTMLQYQTVADFTGAT